MPIFALVFVDVLGLTVILPLLHLYAAAFGATALEIGIVAAAFPLAQLVGVPAMGALSDRFGRKPLLLISQVTTCLSFIMLGMANSLTMVILSRVLDGLFGANIATAQAALSDSTDEKNRARGLGLTGAAFGLGFIFGPILSILALELGDSLAIPAFSAAGYSFISILLTLFVFKETLPPEERQKAREKKQGKPHIARAVMPIIIVLLLLMFGQQFIFYGFETLMGLFTLTRLGLLGQGNAALFLFIGILLVVVQTRFIGKWASRHGEARMVLVALGLLAAGLLLVATTPEQTHPFYVKAIVENNLIDQAQTNTEAIVGDIGITLPETGNNGLGGLLWFLVALIPLSIGAGLIRPLLNTLLTKIAGGSSYGVVLGFSSATVSAANAAAPIVMGLIFQQYGEGMPFLIGGILMTVLVIIAGLVFRATPSLRAAT
ncbi:MAG: hypothetical protein CL607_13205 [Anaerolineaceae bacterium]|nr:hypothetical protein [Anaerolineaceae bacterium]